MRQTFHVQAFIVLDENGQIVRSAAAAGFAAADVTKPIRAVIRNRDEAFLNADSYWAGIQRGTGPQKNLIFAAFFPTPARITELNAKIGAEREYYVSLAQNRSGVPRYLHHHSAADDGAGSVRGSVGRPVLVQANHRPDRSAFRSDSRNLCRQSRIIGSMFKHKTNWDCS